MDDGDFLMTFPAFIIGEVATGDSSQRLAAEIVGDCRAMMVFTEAIFAERKMDHDHHPGGIFVIPKRKDLANLIRRHRDDFELVLIDPNPTTQQGTAFYLIDFLYQLES